jgi:hypothetical protein
MRDGEGWRGRFLVSTRRYGKSLMVWGRHRDQVADAVIEAQKLIRVALHDVTGRKVKTG